LKVNLLNRGPAAGRPEPCPRRRRQIVVALRLLVREHQRRLRLVDLCLVRVDLCLLHNDLSIDGLDARLCRRYLRLGHGKRIAVIALVDLGDHLAGGDVLVIGDRDRREVSGHLGRDGELARAMKASSVDSKWEV
jgi:hypothetical protein